MGPGEKLNNAKECVGVRERGRKGERETVRERTTSN